jgi:alpha-2-macroglobulin
MKKIFLIGMALSTFVLSGLINLSHADEQNLKNSRTRAEKASQNGNYKDAFELYEKLVLDQDNDPKLVAGDLEQAINCLRNLDRINEIDDLRERAVSVQKNNWRLLSRAASSYYNEDHNGYIIAGKFERGYRRGGNSQYVNSYMRDRIRALQLMTQAMASIQVNADKNEAADFYLQFAGMLMGTSGYDESWRLQYLSDLSQLPDYDDGYYYTRSGRFAPVDSQGNPVFYGIPKTYNKADSDGERWRWMLQQAMETEPGHEGQALSQYADFLNSQFGVETMSDYSSYFYRSTAAGSESKTRTYQLHTLQENETLARLATGIKRFKLPEDANYIKLYQKIAENKNHYGEEALDKLARIFENRRQYDQAAEYWVRSIKEYGPGSVKYKQKRLDQIRNNWGQFEPIMSQAAGKPASVEYRFRNGRSVKFTAHEINVSGLLEDVKKYLESNPATLDRNKMNIENVGYRLVVDNQTQYIGKKAAQWTRSLQPADMHFDRRITVETPLKKAGAYLLTAQMEDGNKSQIIIWLNDTVIVKKPLSNGTFLYVADAENGRPLAGMQMEFFGYRMEATDWQKISGRRYNIETDKFSYSSDGQGRLMLGRQALTERWQWLITAGNKAGRLAYIGFSSVWYSDNYDYQYNEPKTFIITDRPVYRPGQTVKFKCWISKAQYDSNDDSSFGSNKSFTVRIYDPQYQKVLEKSITADNYGGLEWEYLLPEDAGLGSYTSEIYEYGGSSFRVEEYKKPEYEVKVEAPKEPIQLGDKFSVTIAANYYFGAPVTKATVKYKVLRSSYDAAWYPPGIWDWLYGAGYGWFAYDYDWYPGWLNWGCKRPHPSWWPRTNEQPELVAEGESDIGDDGTVKIDLDTSLVKEMHGDQDHQYTITAEVVDQSRRTIVGEGIVLVGRNPFKVHAWVDRGHYRAGDVIQARFNAFTLDQKPVQGKGELKLFQIQYKDKQPIETLVQQWSLNTDSMGQGQQQIKASAAGQYRLSCKVTDSRNHTMEGGYVFYVRGEGTDTKQFRFNEIELIPEKSEYSPDEKVRLMINTDQPGNTVVLFIRPVNGAYLEPKIIQLKAQSHIEEIPVTAKDMPNFFVEAFTITGSRCFTETREIMVPPVKKVLNVDVLPSAEVYKPGQEAKVRVKLTDLAGRPFSGSTVMTVYDKSVEYISGGSNVPSIREFFWSWRRSHNPRTETNLGRYFYNLVPPKQDAMSSIGIFGATTADDESSMQRNLAIGGVDGEDFTLEEITVSAQPRSSKAAAEVAAPSAALRTAEDKDAGYSVAQGTSTQTVQPQIRSEFADTAFWAGSLKTDINGIAEVKFKMPENLTTWMIKTWAMGAGTRVGETKAEVVTSKNVIIRLQAPRFFTEKDEVVLSANIHNYLDKAKKVQAVLELDGGFLQNMEAGTKTIEIASKGEARVDWRVRVVKEGEATVRMKALTDQESDAMEQRFPVYVHGMLKTESYSGAIRQNQSQAVFRIQVPEERRPDQSQLEVRYSPTLAGAMVDALPYLADYPYGCTEQTLSRFLPTVITRNVLTRMGLDLAAIQKKRTNLNSQEIGDDAERATQWKRFDHNPIFDEGEMNQMIRQGLQRLTNMQLSDGGWGWFSGWGEQSMPHTTAWVVQGFLTAGKNDLTLPQGVLERGVAWLENFQKEQVQELKNFPSRKRPNKEAADNLDAFVYKTLIEAGKDNKDMRDFLYRDRNGLSLYGKSLLGVGLYLTSQKDNLQMVMQNIEQYLVQDKENQTAYLNVASQGYWWYWYGSEFETQAYYLKLLALTDPKSEKAAGLAKYLLNNRKNGAYWSSTRDTALCIEALADYLKASAEDKPDMVVSIYVDGKKKKEVSIKPQDLFTFDNKLVLSGTELSSGPHEIKIVRQGNGPVYFNAYMTNFTLEDFISKAGLEIKVERRYYKLNKVDKTIKVSGSSGQALDQKVEKYERVLLPNLSTLKSGDLVEIELEIESKNDYEYLMFEDMKAAGFEPISVQSGYTHNGLSAYMELRDERVCFFLHHLARGKHSLSYRMRAEIPGRFSALPTKAQAMYAPELKANSDEIKILIED